jgi:hypothetical protein
MEFSTLVIARLINDSFLSNESQIKLITKIKESFIASFYIYSNYKLDDSL